MHPFYRNSDNIPEKMTKKKLFKLNYNWSMYNVDDIMYTADIYMGSNQQHIQFKLIQDPIS